MMQSTEVPVFIECQGERLLGILHRARGVGDVKPKVGVLIVVGGPQYRIGSHRQFVITARRLAEHGIPVLRFDHRGIGDSSGEFRGFERLNQDIAAATNAFFQKTQGLEHVVTWGLCDAATANALYSIGDKRIAGQIALNPWVRAPGGEAAVLIKHYYPKRALSRSFWKKIISFQYDLSVAFSDLIGNLRNGLKWRNRFSGDGGNPLSEKLRIAQTSFEGPTFIVLSGQDLTAREYESQVNASPDWKAWCDGSTVELLVIKDADHTFSRMEWTERVASQCIQWIEDLDVSS